MQAPTQRSCPLTWLSTRCSPLSVLPAACLVTTAESAHLPHPPLLPYSPGAVCGAAASGPAAQFRLQGDGHHAPRGEAQQVGAASHASLESGSARLQNTRLCALHGVLLLSAAPAVLYPAVLYPGPSCSSPAWRHPRPPPAPRNPTSHPIAPCHPTAPTLQRVRALQAQGDRL